MFRHIDPAAARSQPDIVDRRILAAHSTGHGYHELVGPWAIRCQCTRMEVHDPYLPFVRQGPHLAQTMHMVSDELLAFAEDRGLDQVTWLGLVHPLIAAVAQASPQLTEVHVITRGQLRHDCPWSGLLQQWGRALHDQWQPRGISVTTAISGVHTRRIVLQGALTTFEILPEWGLALYADTEDNLLRPPECKTVRRTEVMVLQHDAATASPSDWNPVATPPVIEDGAPQTHFDVPDFPQ